MNPIIRQIISFTLAWIALVMLSSAIGAQFVLAEFSAMGKEIGIGDWFSVTFGDMFNMMPIYSLFNGRATWSIVFGLSLLLSMIGAAITIKLAPPVFRNNKHIVYPVAGFFGIIAGLMILGILVEAILQSNVVLIAPTRTFLGTIFQALAGAFGGYVYYIATQKFS